VGCSAHESFPSLKLPKSVFVGEILRPMLHHVKHFSKKNRFSFASLFLAHIKDRARANNTKLGRLSSINCKFFCMQASCHTMDSGQKKASQQARSSKAGRLVALKFLRK